MYESTRPTAWAYLMKPLKPCRTCWYVGAVHHQTRSSGPCSNALRRSHSRAVSVLPSCGAEIQTVSCALLVKIARWYGLNPAQSSLSDMDGPDDIGVLCVMRVDVQRLGWTSKTKLGDFQCEEGIVQASASDGFEDFRLGDGLPAELPEGLGELIGWPAALVLCRQLMVPREKTPCRLLVDPKIPNKATFAFCSCY